MSGRRKTYLRRQSPRPKDSKKRAKLRKKAIEKLQNGHPNDQPTETEVQLQIMSDLLNQESGGESGLSHSERILLNNVLVTWLGKIQKDINKFEHLRYSDYKEHCTIHGLYDVFISKSQLERFIWILTLIGCFILAVICSKIQVNEWYQSLETTNAHFASWDLNLPDIIICPDLLLNKSQVESLVHGTIEEDEEYRDHFLNPRKIVSLREKLAFYTKKIRSFNYTTMIEHAEYPNIYLPFIPRNYPKRVVEFVEQGNGYEDAQMVYGNKSDFYKLKEFFKSQSSLKISYREKKILNKIVYKCDSILLTYDASLKVHRLLKKVQHRYFSLRKLAPNLDEILNITGRNYTNEEVLELHGVLNFCSRHVKETFEYHHKCYRFNSKEIFMSNNKNSIGIILPNNTAQGLLGKKGIWFSIVDEHKNLTDDPLHEVNNDEHNELENPATNNLSWVYLRPGAHTVNIDATRNLILRDPPGSRCYDADLQSNYDYANCVVQTCDPITNKTYHDCILPINADSEVDTRHRNCMKMPNSVNEYYNECVKKCEKYCDFWTYTISEVQSQKFNPEVAGQFLRDMSELNSRYYIRLLYLNSRYTHREQKYKITLIEFIANIGGISGFCVGMSIMSLFQIILYLIMAKIGHAQRRRVDRNHSRKREDQAIGNPEESIVMIKEDSVNR